MEGQLQASIPMWLAAALPIAVVLYLMVVRRWGGTKAGPAGWLTSLLVAATVYQAGPAVLLASQGKALFRSLLVLYIIWMALALYQVVKEAGALEAIGAGMSRLTADRAMQLLVLAWVFASFLQGVTGFGVPVAVVAPMLVGLGFPALTAVVATGVAHGWAVTFGSLASSFYAMIAVTGIDGHVLAPWSAAMLGLAALPCGMAVAVIHRGRAGLRHALPAILVLAGVMGGTQLALASLGMWSLASFGGGIAGLAAVTLVTRVKRYRGTDAERGAAAQAAVHAPAMSMLEAMSAYLVLLVIVLAVRLVGPVRDLVQTFALQPRLPETSTALGWVNPATAERPLYLLGHAGAQILFACVVAWLIFRLRGRYAPGSARRIAGNTLRGSVKPTVGILFMVGMAMFMVDSGMTYVLAVGVSRALGPVYPLAAPFIGALGAFMTGSNTNSNVLFAPLQQGTATMLGLSVPLTLAAQNLGGAIGSVFAPAKVIVGCSTVGLGGAEGEVLRRILLYGIAIVALGGLVTALLSLLL